MFSLSLSLLLALGGPDPVRAGSAPRSAHEPAAPLGASATLVRVFDEAGGLRALVRLDLEPGELRGDAHATIAERIGPEGRPSLRPLVSATLRKGERRSFFVQSDLRAGRENHLFYTVAARDRDDARIETVVYLRVNLDENLEPRAVEGCLEYAGAAGAEVEP